jgi:hypothetical protein
MRLFGINSVAVPLEHSFFTIMKELRKINLVAMTAIRFKGHKEMLRGIIKYLGLQFKKFKTTYIFKERNDEMVWEPNS